MGTKRWEIDVSLVVGRKNGRRSYERFAREGKKFRKNARDRVQFSKVKSSTRPSFHPRPAKNEGEGEGGKSFERTEADIDYYTPSRIEMCLELFARSRASKKTVLRDFIGIFDKATPG